MRLNRELENAHPKGQVLTTGNSTLAGDTLRELESLLAELAAEREKVKVSPDVLSEGPVWEVRTRPAWDEFWRPWGGFTCIFGNP